MRVELQHVGVGCNRVVGAISWGPGVVAYAAHHAVVLYDPLAARVVATVLGHTDVVNCVAWVPTAHWGPTAHAGCSPAAVLASGAADNTVRLWLCPREGPAEPWAPLAALEGHSAPVTSLSIFSQGPSSLLLVSTAGDGEVCVWECGAGSPAGAAQAAWRLRQRIHVGFQMQHCTALARLPADPDWLVLALGGVDAHVRLLTCPPGGEFSEVCRLLGHQDWVRGLAFAQVEEGGSRLLLASASQDKYVRIWAIKELKELQEQQGPSPSSSYGGPSSAAAAQGAALAPAVLAAIPGASSMAQQPLDLAALSKGIARYAPKPRIAAGARSYSATLEALLIGHEDWVQSVAWHPPVPAEVEGGGDAGAEGGRRGEGAAQRWVQPPCLLSASMDRTMMIWRPDETTGLWMSVETVGDAGPNHLGYYTGVYNGDGAGILAHGYTGALHLWLREGDSWVPKHALGGHWAPVVDACWGVGDACLLTVSVDQTARITSRLHGGHWCEIARPQVHGHDFSSAAFIPTPGASGRALYASGSEEKVVRVFEAPQAFWDTVAMARGQAVAPRADGSAAFGAALPALGLSNKAVYAESEDESSLANGGTGAAGPGGSYTEGPDFAPNAVPSAVAGPPLEEHLAQNTLWPEVRKLYGHGNELYCLAADPLGAYLASACRAQSPATAGIWLWDCAKWVGLGALAAHTLTVTQLAFSPCGRWLASGSRDRSVALFERCARASPPFQLVGRQQKAHARIVWGVAWSPDSRLLVTGSRDNSVKLWVPSPPAPQQMQKQQEQQAQQEGDQQQQRLSSGRGGGLALVATLPFGDAVRSVAFAPAAAGSDAAAGAGTGGAGQLAYTLAVGLEDGSIHLLVLQCRGSGSVGPGGLILEAHSTLWHSTCNCQHAAAVRRLCWRRDGGGDADGSEQQGQRLLQLASCGDDHAVRVYAVHL